MLKAKGYFNTPSYLAWAFQSGSPLKSDFDRIILKLSEVIILKLILFTASVNIKSHKLNMKAGLIEYWLEELLVSASKEGKEADDDKGKIQQQAIFFLSHFFLTCVTP